jgi:hypothetical protein
MGVEAVRRLVLVGELVEIEIAAVDNDVGIVADDRRGETLGAYLDPEGVARGLGHGLEDGRRQREKAGEVDRVETLLFVEADLGEPSLGELDHLTVVEGAGQVETALPRLFGVRLETEIVSHWDSPAIRLSRRST